MTKQVFLSYSRRDSELRDQLARVLDPLQRTGLIHLWHDQEIPLGHDWRSTIDQKIHEADLILFLVTADFLQSDYCNELELTTALRRWKAQQVQIIPIIARDCLWEQTPLATLQVVLLDSKPITTNDNQDDAWAYVGRKIHEAVTSSIESAGAVPRQAKLQRTRNVLLGVAGIASLLSVVTIVAFAFLTSGPTASGSAIGTTVSLTEASWLHIDDVLVQTDEYIVLDVRIRNSGNGAVNVTRANLRILDPAPPRPVATSAYKESAVYNARVNDADNFVSVAHVLQPGEVDRFKIVVTAAREYRTFRAQLELVYNGDFRGASKQFEFTY